MSDLRESIKVSELDRSHSISDNDIFLISKESNGLVSNKIASSVIKDYVYNNISSDIVDKINECLPLSGGIDSPMTGTIYTENEIALSKKGQNPLVLIGGDKYDKPSKLKLYSNNTKGFELEAAKNYYGDLSSVILEGYYDGRLTWGGKNIVRSVNDLSADINGNVTITNVLSSTQAINSLSSNIAFNSLSSNNSIYSLSSNNSIYSLSSNNSIYSLSSDQSMESLKLKNSITISISGDVEGKTLFNGSEDVTINAKVKDDSHIHTIDTLSINIPSIEILSTLGELAFKDKIISNDISGTIGIDQVEGLQNELDSKISSVVVTPLLETGTKLATITVNGNETDIYGSVEGTQIINNICITENTNYDTLFEFRDVDYTSCYTVTGLNGNQVKFKSDVIEIEKDGLLFLFVDTAKNELISGNAINFYIIKNDGSHILISSFDNDIQGNNSQLYIPVSKGVKIVYEISNSVDQSFRYKGIIGRLYYNPSISISGTMGIHVINSDYIKDQYGSIKWYRLYSDGWCEQGGSDVIPIKIGDEYENDDPSVFCELLLEFRDVFYSCSVSGMLNNTGSVTDNILQLSAIHSYTAPIGSNMFIHPQTTKTIRVTMDNPGVVYWNSCDHVRYVPFFWEAKGFVDINSI